MSTSSKRSAALVAVFVALVATCVLPAGAQAVTLETLLAEMTDLRRLATGPAGYTTTQFSSRDRRSTTPDAPHWFGNADGFGRSPVPAFERVLDAPGDDGIGRYLVCDVEGPGALVRTWTAAMPGTLSVWIDGASEPWYRGPAERFLAARGAWVVRDAQGLDLGDAFRQQEANYFPVPFAKRLRIEYRGDLKKRHFYHIGVRRYAAGTEVRSMPAAVESTTTGAIGRAAAALRAVPEPAGASVPLRFAMRPGARAMHACDGPGEVRRLRLRVDAPDDPAARDAALRGVVLRIRFDDASVAQVEAPLGDFFGAVPGVIPYASLPMRVAADGTMTCDFVMPFRARAAIELENTTAAPVTVVGEAILAEVPWRDGASLYFRAGWSHASDVTADPKRPVDVPWLVASGRPGRLVGISMTVVNPSPVPTAWGNWWGEGDEKFRIDGETEPSWFGTGAEDYFNYAWSRPTPFAHPYCAMPHATGPGHRGYVSNVRWHVLDDVAFRSSIDTCIELLHHSRTPGVSVGVTRYWYAAPGVAEVRAPFGRRDLVVPPLVPWLPVARLGSARARFHQLESCEFSGDATPFGAPGMSGLGGLLWQPKKAGDRFGTPYSTGEEAAYRFTFVMRTGPDVPAFRVRVGGKLLARVVDGRRLDPETPIDLATDGPPRLVNVTFAPASLGIGDLFIVLEATRPGRIAWDFYAVQKVPHKR